MSVTKAVHLDDRQYGEIRRVADLMPEQTEDRVLRDVIARGTEALKRELVARLYRSGLSTGEIAQRLGMGRIAVMEALQAAGVPLFDVDPQLFAAQLQRRWVLEE